MASRDAKVQRAVACEQAEQGVKANERNQNSAATSWLPLFQPLFLSLADQVPTCDDCVTFLHQKQHCERPYTAQNGNVIGLYLAIHAANRREQGCDSSWVDAR